MNIKYLLLVSNIFLVFFLILLSNLGVLPVKNLGDFAFFSALALIIALYRPGWAFLFFVGTVVLENINLAPEDLGINLRPFQLIGGVVFLAVLMRFFLKRLNFSLIKLKWYDFSLIAFGALGFVSALASQYDKGLSLKLSVIISSFIILYFLTRIYIQCFDDFKRIIPFFLSSSAIVVFYAIWQNIRFKSGLSHFEAMPGRPNATFTEADWLGIFLVLLIAILYAMIFYKNKNFTDDNLGLEIPLPQWVDALLKSSKDIFLYLFLTIAYIALIISVSRSAWIGAIMVTVVFIINYFTDLKLKNWKWKETINLKLKILAAFLFAIIYVYAFNLTDFQLFNRIQSARSGLQKITVSCNQESSLPVLPEKIGDISDLEKYGCRHINLEDIEKEKVAGNFIAEIYREDPNVNIRKETYQKSWQEIRGNPILGIGWGNIGEVLGKDERGATLNSSNVFLEVWLGTGILGLLLFISVWAYIFLRGIKLFKEEDLQKKTYGLFLILGFFALLVPNIFNAGIFLGILWIFLGTGFINYENRN